MVPEVMVILGSGSDLEIAKKTMGSLEELQISYSLKVASAHRTHEKVKNLVINATENGVKVFIAIAGLSAHLSGSIASYTHRPVISVPVNVKLSGLDSLLSSVQTPYPASIATVGIDRGDNAGILAGEILAISNEKIKNNLHELRETYHDKIYLSEKEILSQINGSHHEDFQINGVNNNFKDKNSNDELTNNELTNNELTNNELTNNELTNNVDVAVILDSYSNIKVGENIIELLNKLEISYDFKIISPIANPTEFEDYINTKNVKLFIGVGGLSAHITGSIVALSEKLVIGVPCSNQLNGLDALFSMVNMPPGVPVATVGINNGYNGALLIGKILGINDKKIETNLKGEIANERIFKEI
ncbi:MAG: 5-(carboxyamino)imidazole ribonucleotide mutase [Methanobrevibacter sp.]|jgi:5-(carboxyamino)imidazole ribonucleotide mutase|nr:5-(carboxyamino)imidazole ribonucleotide mutase [Candidatus Methanovirga meridionalis]